MLSIFVDKVFSHLSVWIVHGVFYYLLVHTCSESKVGWIESLSSSATMKNTVLTGNTSLYIHLKLFFGLKVQTTKTNVFNPLEGLMLMLYSQLVILNIPWQRFRNMFLGKICIVHIQVLSVWAEYRLKNGRTHSLEISSVYELPLCQNLA